MNLLPIHPHDPHNRPPFLQPECREIIAAMGPFYEQVGFELPWVGYFILQEGEVVGTCSFVGAPKAGRVEIAYFTFPEYEGRGIASLACAELVRIAHAADPSLTITAKTAPEYNASTRILQKNGFVHTGSVEDEEIGEAWGWERVGTK